MRKTQTSLFVPRENATLLRSAPNKHTKWQLKGDIREALHTQR